MGLLKNIKLEKELVFDKEEVKNSVIEMIELDFPNYLVISQDHPLGWYDILLTKNITREIKISIASLNPYSKHEHQTFQELIAIKIAPSSEEIAPDSFEKIMKFVHKYLIIDTPKLILKHLTP